MVLQDRKTAVCHLSGGHGHHLCGIVESAEYSSVCVAIRIGLPDSVCVCLLDRSRQGVSDISQSGERCAGNHLQAPHADRLDSAVHIGLRDVVGKGFICLWIRGLAS